MIAPILGGSLLMWGTYSPSDRSGSIDREEFLQIPQIVNNPLASRMIAIFDEECVAHDSSVDPPFFAFI